MFPRCFSNKTGKWLPDHGHWMGVLLKWLTGRKFLEVLFYHIAFSTVLNRSVVSNSLRPHGLQPSRLLCLWDFPGKNNGVGCHFLLQGIFPTQGLNTDLLHCGQILYQLSYKGSPICWLRGCILPAEQEPEWKQRSLMNSVFQILNSMK